MATFKRLYGINSNPETIKESKQFVSSRRVGIELEYERIKIDPYTILNLDLWEITEDGSLRMVEPGTMSLELRYKRPLGGLDSEKALVSLNRFLKRDSTILVSERTGLHVHVDFRDVSIDQLRNFYIYYLLSEPFLYNYSGAGRDKNIFCVPMYRTPAIITGQLNLGAFTAKSRIGRSLQSMHKYSGINLGSLARKGSIEFRMHPSSTDVNRIQQWINILLKLTEEGTTAKINVRKLLKRGESGINLVEEIFKEHYQYLAVGDISKSLEIGLESVYAATISANRASVANSYLTGRIPEGGLREYNDTVLESALEATRRRLGETRLGRPVDVEAEVADFPPEAAFDTARQSVTSYFAAAVRANTSADSTIMLDELDEEE